MRANTLQEYSDGLEKARKANRALVAVQILVELM